MLKIVICCVTEMSSSENGLENEVSFDFFAIDMARFLTKTE